MTQIKNSGNFGLIDASKKHQQQPKHTGYTNIHGEVVATGEPRSDYKRFLMAIALWYGTGDLNDIDFTEEDVVKTHQPIDDFITSAGETKNGLRVREDFQIAKGLRRGILFAKQFDGFTLVATTAEGTMKGE